MLDYTSLFLSNLHLYVKCRRRGQRQSHLGLQKTTDSLSQYTPRSTSQSPPSEYNAHIISYNSSKERPKKPLQIQTIARQIQISIHNLRTKWTLLLDESLRLCYAASTLLHQPAARRKWSIMFLAMTLFAIAWPILCHFHPRHVSPMPWRRWWRSNSWRVKVSFVFDEGLFFWGASRRWWCVHRQTMTRLPLEGNRQDRANHGKDKGAYFFIRWPFPMSPSGSHVWHRIYILNRKCNRMNINNHNEQKFASQLYPSSYFIHTLYIYVYYVLLYTLNRAWRLTSCRRTQKVCKCYWLYPHCLRITSLAVQVP